MKRIALVGMVMMLVSACGGSDTSAEARMGGSVAQAATPPKTDSIKSEPWLDTVRTMSGNIRTVMAWTPPLNTRDLYQGIGKRVTPENACTNYTVSRAGTVAYTWLKANPQSDAVNMALRAADGGIEDTVYARIRLVVAEFAREQLQMAREKRIVGECDGNRTTHYLDTAIDQLQALQIPPDSVEKGLTPQKLRKEMALIVGEEVRGELKERRFGGLASPDQIGEGAYYVRYQRDKYNLSCVEMGLTATECKQATTVPNGG